MRQNMHIWMLLTVSCFVLAFSCKTDGAQDEETVDPESGYFDDYESPSHKWGFLNTTGEVVILPKYDLVSGFNEGLAPVNFEGRWGYINIDGDVVIPFEFLAAWQFRDGIAHIMDFTGAPCILYRNGSKMCPPDITEIQDFSEGLAVFERDEAYGYIDTVGTISIAPRFEQAWKFEHGTARVMVLGKQGLINMSGEFVIPAEYEKVYSPSADRILVKQNGSYHFVNMSGDQVSKDYLHATPYAGDVAAVADESGWFLVDLQDKPAMEVRYSNLRPANQQRWIARQAGLFGVLDAHGAELTPFRYSQINNFSEGYAGYMRNDLWGFLDISGKEMTPPQFGLVWDFHEGFARAAFQNGIAFISTSGEVPFSPQFYEMRDFNEGLVPFQEIKEE